MSVVIPRPRGQPPGRLSFALIARRLTRQGIDYLLDNFHHGNVQRVLRAGYRWAQQRGGQLQVWATARRDFERWQRDFHANDNQGQGAGDGPDEPGELNQADNDTDAESIGDGQMEVAQQDDPNGPQSHDGQMGRGLKIYHISDPVAINTINFQGVAMLRLNTAALSRKWEIDTTTNYTMISEPVAVLPVSRLKSVIPRFHDFFHHVMQQDYFKINSISITIRDVDVVSEALQNDQHTMSAAPNARIIIMEDTNLPPLTANSTKSLMQWDIAHDTSGDGYGLTPIPLPQAVFHGPKQPYFNNQKPADYTQFHYWEESEKSVHLGSDAQYTKHYKVDSSWRAHLATDLGVLRHDQWKTLNWANDDYNNEDWHQNFPGQNVTKFSEYKDQPILMPAQKANKFPDHNHGSTDYQHQMFFRMPVVVDSSGNKVVQSATFTAEYNVSVTTRKGGRRLIGDDAAIWSTGNRVYNCMKDANFAAQARSASTQTTAKLYF